MRIANPVRFWVAAAITASVGLLAITIAFEGGSARERTVAHSHGPGHGHRLQVPLELPLGLEPSVTLPEAGSVIAGAETITHFQGGSGAKVVRGTGGGRMIYTGTAAWEPTMGIDKKGNIFYQGEESLIGPKPMVVVSRDGGRSWDDIAPETHLYSQDPFLYVDTRTNRAFTADLTDCLTVSHTDDVGKTWTTSKACGLTDHQNLFAGPPVSSPTVDYPNIVYICAIDGGALADASTATSCLKSLDGGRLWIRTGTPAYTSDPRQPDGNRGIPGFCDGGTGHGVVDSKGVIYLPRGWCGQPYLAISEDEGATWRRVQVADTGFPRHLSGVFEHEAAVAVDRDGTIYYFWMGRNRLPYLAISTDQAKTFSKPMMVGPPGLKEAWGPTIAVGGVGKVALAYVGSTNAPGGRAPLGAGDAYDETVRWNGYITTAIDLHSRKPRFFTASVNPPSDPIERGECGAVRCGVQGDFIDVVIGPDGRPWTSMVDGCPPPGDPCDLSVGLGFVGTVVRGPRLR
jgi:hypothetical protein